jgi:hypothetical protein
MSDQTQKPSREVWKKIPGFRTIFEVSNCGRVRKVTMVAGKLKIHYYKIQTAKNKSGSPKVHLSNAAGDGKYSYYYVIGLFMRAFHGEDFGGMNAKFKDGDRTNISTMNVECVSKSVAISAAKTGALTHKSKTGERNIYQGKYGTFMVQFYHQRKTFHAGTGKTLKEAIEIRDYWRPRIDEAQNKLSILKRMRAKNG